MAYVPAQFSIEEAYHHFNRRRWWQWRAVQVPTVSQDRKIPFAELIWLAHYYMEFRLEARGTTIDMGVTLDGWNGSFSLVELTAKTEDEPEGERLAPRIDQTTAIAMARQELLHTVIRARSRGTRPTPKELLHIELLYLPYWAWYYTPRPGRLDIRLLDAVTGETPGQRIKRAILDALTAKHDGF
jgi:hypothetical protein